MTRWRYKTSEEWNERRHFRVTKWVPSERFKRAGTTSDGFIFVAWGGPVNRRLRRVETPPEVVQTPGLTPQEGL